MILPVTDPKVKAKLQELQDDINDALAKGVPLGTLTDGYHSYNELYSHRIALYMMLCKYVSDNTLKDVWMSKTQSDGTPIQEGWFLLGINKKAGKQITYHIPDTSWDTCKFFAKELAKAPEYDGHTPDDVLTRLATL